MLFDTDVLIWNFRGNEQAGKIINTAEYLETSVVCYMELLQGARDKKEVRSIQSFFKEFGFRILPLSEEIGKRGAFYIEDHASRVGLSVEDALVAATAVTAQAILCTGNVKHYRMIAELDIKPFHPDG